MLCAFSAAGTANPTIVITDMLSFTGTLPACTLAGLNDDSVLNVTSWAIRFSGDTTVKNLRLNSTANHQFLLACGNTLVIDENVRISGNEGVKNLLGIRGGGDGNAINGGTNVIIKSGKWGAVHGGTRLEDVFGDTHITVYDTATVSMARGGNDSPADDHHSVHGNTVI